MADTEIQGISGTLIWNQTKVFIKESSASDTEYAWLAGIAEFQPPSQADNTVDIPYMNQDSRITARVKGTRAGGDISGSYNARNDTDGIAGLKALIEAYEDADGEYSLKWQFPDGTYALVERARITDCSIQGGSLDTVVSYSVAAMCNSAVKYFQPASA